MNGCIYRTENDHCFLYTDDRSESFCVLPEPCECQSPSNADRIRAMTDEELAELFANNDCGYCRIHDFCFSKGSQINCEDVWLDWLREEARNG